VHIPYRSGFDSVVEGSWNTAVLIRIDSIAVVADSSQTIAFDAADF
jgi:hypothetical protein